MAKKFTGKLAEPIDPPKLSILSIHNEQNEKELDRVFNTKIEKLILLAGHYNIPIDDNMNIALALRLAEEFIPGFQETKKKGPSTKWNILTRGILYAEIERMKEGNNKQKGISWAAITLSKKEPWSSFLENDSKKGENPAESLRRAYYKGKDNKWSDIFYDYYKTCLKIDQIKGNSDEVKKWEKQVFQFVNNKE